jgi:DNA-binding transcriptional LysR family regulator
MNDLDWNDLRLFCHVARAGTLAGAAQNTGISAPTLGRAMRALEDRLGRALFARHRTGYHLLPDGQALYDRVRGMEAAARAIEDWREGPQALPIVTVAMGSWMSVFLGGRLNAVWTPEDRFRLCFKTAEAPVDLERREADIALSRDRPETGNVVAIRLGPCAYAPFAARAFDATRNSAWVALGREVAQTPAERWTDSDPARWITVWANARGILYDLTVGGAGRAVLPCYLGDSDPDLMRAGPVIPEIAETLWLIAHADERHRAEVRAMIDRLRAFFDEREGLLSGAMGAAA